MILDNLPKHIDDIHDLECFGKWERVDEAPHGWSLCYYTYPGDDDEKEPRTSVMLAHRRQDIVYERHLYTSGNRRLEYLEELPNPLDSQDMQNKCFTEYEVYDYDVSAWMYMKIALDPKCVFA